MAHLSLRLQSGQSAPSLLNILIWIRPVDLIEIDDIHLQAPQTILHLAPNRVGFQDTTYSPIWIRKTRTLCKYIRLRRTSFDGPRHHFFSVPHTVDGRSIDPVHA